MKQNYGIKEESLLVSRLQNGDQSAVSDIYELYSEVLFGICVKILRNNTGMAEDAFQESMIKIWKYAKSYSPEKGRFFTWILNITRNTAIDFWRKMDKRSEIQKDISDVNVTNPEIIDNPNMDTIDVAHQLGKLTSDERDVIEMAYFTGMTHQQISDQMDIPLGTVKTRIKRGITKLKIIYKAN